jgi:hypothetical protein
VKLFGCQSLKVNSDLVNCFQRADVHEKCGASGHGEMAAVARVGRAFFVVPFSFGYFSFGQAKEK